MVEVAILCWIQFYSVLKEAAYVATAILVPFVILFIWFAIIFYRNLVAHTYETRKCGIQELEELKHVLEMGDELTTTREIRNGPLVNIIWKSLFILNSQPGLPIAQNVVFLSLLLLFFL